MFLMKKDDFLRKFSVFFQNRYFFKHIFDFFSKIVRD